MNCPKCNQVVADNSKFCEHCGAKIEAVSTQESSAAPQQEVSQDQASNPQQEMPQDQPFNPQPQQGMPQGQPFNPQPQQGVPQGQPFNPQPQQGMPQGQPFNPQPQQGMPQGQPFNPQTQQAFSQQIPVKQSKPLSKGLIIGIAAAAAAVVIIVLIIVLVATHKKKINLADYTEVTFSGYDTYGTAYIDFDEETFISDIEKNAKNIKKDYDLSDLISAVGSLSGYWEIYNGIDMTLDKDSALSNGDKVTVSYEFDNDVAKKYGLKFVGKDKEFTVSGLEEVREVDPFEDITVTFSGTAPNVYADVQNNSSDEAVRSLYFSLDKSSGISKGDTVTVTIDYSEEYYLEEYGCTFTSTSKEFTCEEVDAYIIDGGEIGDTVLEQMKSQTQDTIEAYFAQNTDSISVASLTYVGYYFLTAKDQSTWGDKNVMYVVYSGSVSSKEEEGFATTTVYFPVRYENIIKYADGTDYVDLSYTDIQGSTSLSFGWWGSVKGYESLDTMKNELITSQKGEYNDAAFGDLK